MSLDHRYGDDAIADGDFRRPAYATNEGALAKASDRVRSKGRKYLGT